MAGISISTGRVRLEVTRDGEKAGVISFNPTDVGFAERYFSLYNAFDQRIKDYEAEAEALSPTDYQGHFDLMHRIVKDMESEIDCMFGSGTSAIAFGEEENLDMFLSFFESIMPYIQKARAKSVEKYLDYGSAMTLV